MEEWQERVIEEARQLTIRIRKLSGFLYMTDLKDIEPEGRFLLKQQLVAMIQYNIILDQRINHFE